MWTYNSPIGLMRIWLDNRMGKWALEISGTVYGHFRTPEDAASDVYSFVTGCFEWDSIELKVIENPNLLVDLPSDLSGWKEN